MQAFNSIQNATINAIAGSQAGLVAGASNVHRSYLRPERACEVRPVSKYPDVMVCPPNLTNGLEGLKQDHLISKPVHVDCGVGSGHSPTGRTWRIDSRHLPDTAWAMLVLSRSMCG